MFSYVSQNSSFADPCNSLRTRSGSVTPGSSIRILLVPSCNWMFGEVTPNLSIRVRRILNERSIASFDSAVRKERTFALLELILILAEFSLVANKGARLAFGLIFSNSSPKREIKSFWLVFKRFSALRNAALKFASALLFARLRTNSVSEISMVTFMPPFKSSPRGISRCFA